MSNPLQNLPPDLFVHVVASNTTMLFTQVAPLCQIIKFCLGSVALFFFLNLLIGPGTVPQSGEKIHQYSIPIISSCGPVCVLV